MHDRLVVNGQMEIETRISSWFRPIFRFFVGSRPAVIAVRVAPWLAIRSFHLLIDGQVLYCDRRRDLFEENEPGRSFPSGVNRSLSESSAAKDALCPYCDRVLHGVGLDLASLPDELMLLNDFVGRPTLVDSFSRQQRVTLIVAGILASFIGIAVLAAVWLLPEKNPAAEMQGRHAGSALGVLLLGVGPVAVFYALRNRRLHVVAGSEGIVLLENDMVSLCRWEDVETVHEIFVAGEAQTALQASVRGEGHVVRVRCRDGTELVFRNYLDDLPWLRKRIEHETLPYLFPPAIASLKNGGKLSFGPLTLDAEGLNAGPEKRLTWEEVSEVKIAKGILTVMRKGKHWTWFKTPRGQVPNAHILLALVQQYRKGGSGDDEEGMDRTLTTPLT